jgi:DNA-binding MarR family transcriptional regulator
VTDVDPSRTGLSLAALFAGWGLADELQRRLAADGFADARFADGVLFQHLVDGPLTIRVLAERLAVSQQAASKSVADLERRRYLTRTRSADDARARLVSLTERGHSVIAAARHHRATIEAELATHLGPDRIAAAESVLTDVIHHLGAGHPIHTRQVRPPR